VTGPLGGSVTVLSQLVGSVQLRFFRRIAVLIQQQHGLPRCGYGIHPVHTPRSLVAKLEDVRVVLPHSAMGDYRGAVVVVADDQVLGEDAIQTPSGLGQGLAYLLWGHDVSPLSPPSLGERKRNGLTLAGGLP